MMTNLYIAAGIAAVAALGGYKVADWQWSAKWSAHMQADAEANAKAAADALAKQQRLNNELEGAYAKAKQMQDNFNAERAAANDVANRLRQQLDRIKAVPAGVDSTAISERAAAATDARVLAELLAQSDRLAGVYAEQAGINLQSAVNCANEYNAVRAANGRHHPN